MKKIVYGLLLFINAIFITNSANADPTYAVLDANGNVTNIIVCGSACASGEFGGNKVVLQVAADPVTNENRGGFWQGPGTTTYDPNSGVFTMLDISSTINSISEEENGETITSSATIYGGKTTQFRYNDTIGDNLFTRSGFVYGYTENTSASVSVNKGGSSESLFFNDRKTTNEVKNSIESSGLVLLNSKIQTLISLLGSWAK